jgi:2-amino-4-hydroxy-6-hydroxymethyldihydropteridine diphosphokinase
VSRKAVRAYLGIGGNLGDVRATFSGALATLRQTEGILVSRVSPLYETLPVGGPKDQPPFLNAVIEVETGLDAHALLRRELQIETRFARLRAIRWGPRTLDLDLLLYGPGELIDDSPELIVPHPRLTERAFVLVPLAQLTSALIMPGTKCSVEALLNGLPDSERSEVHLISPSWT